MRLLVLFLICSLAVLAPGDADARSSKARYAFVKAHPCPATGKSRGACPGWQVDHIVPLKCGGADSARNMQWLTVSAHKAKTKREAGKCTKKKRAKRTWRR
jgi:5-methylcytosine-specific restriction endonuclease McrA